MLFLWWWQLRWSSLVLVQTHKRVCVCVWESIIVAYSTCIYAHTNRLSNTISCELPCLWRPRVLVMPTFIQESALFGLRVPVSYRSVSFRLSLVPSLSPSQLPDFVPLARSASVKLLAASEIHTNSIHFKCTCRQLPKKKGEKYVWRGSYSIRWQRERDGDVGRKWRWLRLHLRSLSLFYTEKNIGPLCACKKKKKASRKLESYLLLSEPFTDFSKLFQLE